MEEKIEGELSTAGSSWRAKDRTYENGTYVNDSVINLAGPLNMFHGGHTGRKVIDPEFILRVQSRPG